MLSSRAHPAYLANPDANLHASAAHQAGWGESEQETAGWVDAERAQLADHEPRHNPLPPRTWNDPDGDLAAAQVQVHGVEVN